MTDKNSLRSKFVETGFYVAGLLVVLCSAGVAQAWDADLDGRFSYDGKMAFYLHSGDSSLTAAAIQPDGKIVVVGTSDNGANDDFAIARISATGDLDTTFNTDGRAFFDSGWGDDQAGDVVIQPDGKIVVVGVAQVDMVKMMTIVRYHPNGTEDGYASVAFGGNSYGHGVALQRDGKIVVCGRAYFTNTSADFALARFNPDLTMDTSFGNQGRASWDFGDEGYDSAYEVAIRADGNIVIAGTARWSGDVVFGLMVYGTAGNPMYLGVAQFTDDAYGYGLALQPDGKAVVSGRCSTHGGDFAVARFNTNGLLDNTFSGDGKATLSHSASAAESAMDVAIQADGKIVLAGYLFEGGVRQLAVVRYRRNGELDMNFNSTPLHAYTYSDFFPSMHSNANGVAIKPDGTIVTVGYTEHSTGQPAAVACFKGDEDLIFADGFEFGSTSFWSSTVN